MKDEGERIYELQKVTVRLKLENEGSLYSTRRIQSPTEAVEVVAEELAGMDREYFCVVNLDAKGTPLNYNVVSIGDTAEVYVPAQNVFKTALLSNASQLLLFHNHPSSSLQPSYQDISMTKNLVEASRLMGIPIIDHIIVAGCTGLHCSMATMFPDLFDDIDGSRYKAAETGTEHGKAVREGGTLRHSAENHSTEHVETEQKRMAARSCENGRTRGERSAEKPQGQRTQGRQGGERTQRQGTERTQGQGAGRTQRQGTAGTQGRRSLRERLAAKVAQAAETRQNEGRGRECSQRSQLRS